MEKKFVDYSDPNISTRNSSPAEYHNNNKQKWHISRDIFTLDNSYFSSNKQIILLI